MVLGESTVLTLVNEGTVVVKVFMNGKRCVESGQKISFLERENLF